MRFHEHLISPFSKPLMLMCMAGIFGSFAYGQGFERKSSYSREISMTVDNDIIFFEDYYYSAGQDILYRRLADPHSKLYRRFAPTHVDSSKVIITYHGGFKIFTPRDIDLDDTKTMDRPYAGWSFANLGITNFPTARSANQYQVEVGLVGKISGMGQLQNWVHQITDYEAPAGWNTQIRDEVVLNLYYSRFYELKVEPDLDFVWQSAVQAGTGGNKLSQDITMRLLQFNPINNSAFTQSRLSWDTPAQGKAKRHEVFIFVGTGVDYVVSNIFIEGSLFKGNRSVFTLPIQRWVLRRNLGVMFSSQSISWSITFYHLSKEVRDGINHDYASLAMGVRF